jgi:peptide/nickel transport system substrate-binding protein
MRRRNVRHLTIACVLAGLVTVLTATTGAAMTSGAGSARVDAANKNLVTIALPGEPSSMDVLIADDGNMQAISANIFEGLTQRNNKMKVLPQLATSWKRTSPDTWLFTLRRGVKFQNGEAFNSSAAAFSINRVLDPKNNSALTSWVATIASVKTVGAYGLSVTTKGPDPNLPGVLYYVGMMPPKYVTADPQGAVRKPVGTGPYRFVRWDAGQKITLSRWAGYWGKKPLIANISVIWRPEAQVRLAALQAGEVQVTALDSDLAKKAPRVTRASSTDVAELGFDGQPGKPLADQRLRMAINLSIDRKALIKYVFGGFARPARGQLVPAGALGYNAKLKDYPLNLTRAKQLVTAANANGTQINLVAAPGRWQKDTETVQAVAAMIDRSGLKVNIEFLEWSNFLKRIFDRGARADLMYFAGSSDTFDASRIIATLLQSPGAGGTLGRYTNPTIDALLKQAIAAPTIAEKQKIYTRLWQVAYNDAAMIPLFGLENIHGTAKNLVWQARPDNRFVVKDMHYR